jgi:hypothetical protein
MTYSTFINLMLTYKKISDSLSELYNIGFDLYEGKYKIADDLSKMFKASFESHYTTDGIEWIEWFIYENEWGQKDWSKYMSANLKTGELIERNYENPSIGYGARDENGNPICYSYESLWEYIENNHSIKK